MLGEDPELARMLGVHVERFKLGVAAAAGALAALGGALYAHHNTYIEPRNFDIMLGVHSLAYALIGGLGTVFGPLLGVLIDIGVLEGSRVFQGYRMIVFGGLVALLLMFRPRGLLDEKVVHWLKRAFCLSSVPLVSLPAARPAPAGASSSASPPRPTSSTTASVRLARDGQPLPGRRSLSAPTCRPCRWRTTSSR